MQKERKYGFSWALIGDLQAGRPNLGADTRVEVYRLMQYCIRDVIEKRHGTEEADSIFYAAGKLAGYHFYENMIGEASDLKDLVRKLQDLLMDLGIGILKVEKSDPEKGEFILTVSEDLDCSGLPELDFAICSYDEGFIAALMESYTGKRFEVKETDCWCTGDHTCRFTARVVK